MKFILTAALLGFNSWLLAQNQLTIIIDSLPGKATADTIFIAGSFNGWHPGKAGFAFKNKQIQLNLPAGNIEFKLTRGDWDKAEVSVSGSPVDNRRLEVKGDTTVHINVKGWQDQFQSVPATSTASKQVFVLDTAFVIPQLNRKRRIWLYLPKDYSTTAKHYPVLYMHDGQNLFDAATGFAGEWGVDEFLDSTLLKSCIVVGIDHGNDKRLTEYNPFDHQKFGKGEGDLYLDFLVSTLKPYIDNHYRTLHNNSNTFIAGSSMGGLISMYAAMRYPKIFGRVGVFSPAFWVSKADLVQALQSKIKSVFPAIYLYAGGKESKEMVGDMNEIATIVKKKFPQARVKMVVNPAGQHSEGTWRSQFPAFYRWLVQ